MTPYLLLIGISFVAQYIAIKKNNNIRTIIIGKSVFIQNNNLSLIVFFLGLTIMLMVRHESVGKDLLNYKYIFQICSKSTIESLQKIQIEPLYRLFNWGIGQITSNYQIFIAVIAMITVIPIAIIYCEERKYGYLKLILFVNMSTFVMLFSGIRQSLAIGLGMIAYYLTRKKAFLRYFIVCVIAMGIHMSAFMLLFMYPMYHLNFRKKDLGTIGLGIIVLFVFNEQIFNILGKILELFTDYSAIITTTKAYSTLIMFVLFLVFVYVIIDEKKMTHEVSGRRNFLVIAVVIQCFAPLNSLAMRMGYYYIIFIPLIIADALSYRKPKYAELAKLAEVAISLFFTIVFVWGIYHSFVTGESMLNTIPYKFFWKG